MELADTYTAKAINAAIKKNSISTKPISVAKKGRCIRINKDSVTLIYRDRKNGDTTLTLGEWGGVYGITCKQAEKEITNRLGEKKEQKKKKNHLMTTSIGNLIWKPLKSIGVCVLFM